MRHPRRCHHIQRTGTDGGGDRHGAAAVLCLGIGHGNMGHGLFIMAAPGRQRIADAMQRLAKPRHVAVAKDCPDPGDKGLAVVVHLIGQIAHHGLCCGQPDGFSSGHAAFLFAARARSQTVHSAR